MRLLSRVHPFVFLQIGKVAEFFSTERAVEWSRSIVQVDVSLPRELSIDQMLSPTKHKIDKVQRSQHKQKTKQFHTRIRGPRIQQIEWNKLNIEFWHQISLLHITEIQGQNSNSMFN